MAVDSDARQLTINYTGGSLTMSIGNLKDLLGANYDNLMTAVGNVSTSVSSHSRTRVIGGPTTTVISHSRDYKGWPTSQANGAAAGKKVILQWEGTDGAWVGRVTGAMADFADWLNTNTTKIVTFRTARGTKYGPFNDSSN